MKKKNSYAVITGASSGIGEEFVKRLAREGYKIILVARRKERLEATKEKLTAAEVECEIITADLGQISECRRLMDALSEKNIGVFINNAGFGDCGYFEETDVEKELEMDTDLVTAISNIVLHLRGIKIDEQKSEEGLKKVLQLMEEARNKNNS